eukprot:6979054-Prymnesium_polylepis.1
MSCVKKKKNEEEEEEEEEGDFSGAHMRATSPSLSPVLPSRRRWRERPLGSRRPWAADTANMVFSTEACYQEMDASSGDAVEVDTSTITFGIILGCIGSVGINTGNNLQAVGLKALEAKRESMGLPADSKELQPQKSPVWAVGT